MEEARVRGGLVGADLSKGNARIVVVSSLRCCDCTSCSSAERSIVSASLPNHSLPAKSASTRSEARHGELLVAALMGVAELPPEACGPPAPCAPGGLRPSLCRREPIGARRLARLSLSFRGIVVGSGSSRAFRV